MRSDDYNIKQCILDYAQNHEQFEINQLVTELKMKSTLPGNILVH